MLIQYKTASSKFHYLSKVFALSQSFQDGRNSTDGSRTDLQDLMWTFRPPLSGSESSRCPDGTGSCWSWDRFASTKRELTSITRADDSPKSILIFLGLPQTLCGQYYWGSWIWRQIPHGDRLNRPGFRFIWRVLAASQGVEVVRVHDILKDGSQSGPSLFPVQEAADTHLKNNTSKWRQKNISWSSARSLSSQDPHFGLERMGSSSGFERKSSPRLSGHSYRGPRQRLYHCYLFQFWGSRFTRWVFFTLLIWSIRPNHPLMA